MNKLLPFAVVFFASACARSHATSGVKDTVTPAPNFAHIAECTSLNDDDRFVVRLREDMATGNAEATMDRAETLDPATFEPEVMLGKRLNFDERDPYQYEYEFQMSDTLKLKVLITLERQNDYYPAMIKQGAATATAMACTL